MRDAGPDIKRRSCNGLANAMQRDFLNTWVMDNQANFIEVMELIKEGNPVKYAELYLRAIQMGIIKETNVNINVSRQQDYDNLQALVRTRVTPSLPSDGSYTPYEEVRQPTPLKKEEEP